MATWNWVVRCSVLVVVLAVASSVNAAADKYADVVVDYWVPAIGDGTPTSPNFQDPLKALGAPDYHLPTETGAVSLGVGGWITLQFTDQLLAGSGDALPDLKIHEIGADIEDTFVWISKDGTFPPLYPNAGWDSTAAGYVGKLTGGIDRELDIDAYGHGLTDEFPYLRIQDDPNEGTLVDAAHTGADIDAVELAPFTAIPEPLTMIGLLTGLAVVGRYVRRRRLA